MKILKKILPFFIFIFIFTGSSFLFGNELTQTPKKVRFIINPKSGVKSNISIEDLIHKNLNKSLYDYEICYTKAANHATELAKEAVEKKYYMVVAVGGDGTINETGKGLINSNSIMGIIPMGSGNGLARHLNISIDPLKAIEILNHPHETIIDTVKINDTAFLGIAGIGFDAAIAHKFAHSTKRGFWSYASLVAKSYPGYKPQKIEMLVDGKKISTTPLLLSFANGSQYGNNIRIAPLAKIDDGFIQVVILEKPAFFKAWDTLNKLKKGKINKSKYYQSIKCKEVVIDKSNLIAHIDGEPIKFENGIKITVIPHSLKILIP